MFRKRRVALGLTLATLAHRIGVQKNSLSRWESGETSPTLVNLTAWANSLGHRIDAPPI